MAEDFEDLAPGVEQELVETVVRPYLRAVDTQLQGVTPRASGDLARSYRYRVNGSEHRDGASAGAAVRSLQDDVDVVSTDPAFAVIDLGVHVGRDGRRKGSSKAPRGIAAPAALAADRIVGARG